MAKKMTPGELRAKAKTMLEQAKIEEDKLYMKAGRLAQKELNMKGAFSSNDPLKLKTAIDELKNKINKILEG